MKLQIIPFKVRHLDVIKPDITPEQKRMAEAAGGYAFTGCILGDPVGCAGVMVDDEGIGWGWSLFTPTLKAIAKIQLLKTAKRLLDEVTLETGLKEVKVIVDPDDSTAVKFASWLGFDVTKPKHIYTRRSDGE